MSNIGQFRDVEHQGHDMIINTEWCNIGSRHLPKTEFDALLDQQSNNPGVHSFEKMTTGMYLGEITRQVLVHLIHEKVLSFDLDQEEDDECLLLLPYQFDTSYMYVCEADVDDLEDTRLVLEDMCRVGETTLEDRRIVKKVCELVGHRAALLLGAGIASVVKYMVEYGIGIDDDQGFAIGKWLASASSDTHSLTFDNSHQRRCLQRLPIVPSPCLRGHQGLDPRASGIQAIRRHRATLAYCGRCHCSHDG